jgi:rhodanese-related sulfurtransferase
MIKKLIALFVVVLFCFATAYYFLVFKKNRDFSYAEQMVRDFQSLKDREKHSEKFIDIEKEEAKKMVDDKSVKVLDVSSHFEKGHLPGAIDCYLNDGSLDKVIAVLDKNEKYLVYSISDESSITGSQKLINNGFKNVYRLNGNFDGWNNSGFPIEFNFLPVLSGKGSGSVVRSFNSQTEEYLYVASVKLGELKEKEFYQAYFLKAKPQETFDMGILDGKKENFVMTYASKQDFKRFDNFVIVLNNEEDPDFRKEKIVLEARINNF